LGWLIPTNISSYFTFVFGVGVVIRPWGFILATLFLSHVFFETCIGQPYGKLEQVLRGNSPIPTTASSTLEQRLEQMEKEVNVLRKQLSSLEDRRLDQARAQDVRQMIKEILSDEQFRDEIYQPTLQAGYDHGFFIRTADDAFYLRTRLRTQFRYVGIDRQDRNRTVPASEGKGLQNNVSAFEWERMRLYFDGWLWSKNLKYVFALEGSTNNSDSDVTLYEAYFDYEYSKDQNLRWGEFKVPFGKQNVFNSSFKQEFVDISVPASTFYLGRALGLMVFGDILIKTVTYNTGLFNGFNNGQDDPTLLDSRFAVAGRFAYHLLPGYDEDDESDYEYHEKPAMDIGGSYAYNRNDGDVGSSGNGRQPLTYAIEDLVRAGEGGYGTSLDLGTEVLQLGVDAGFKYRGLSISAEYYFRHVESDHFWSQWNTLTARGLGTSSPQGGYVQAGYFIIPKKLEITGRLGGVWGLGDDQTWEEALGVNYYIHGHALKLSADVTHVEEVPITNSQTNLSVNDRVWMYRIQIQATMD